MSEASDIRSLLTSKSRAKVPPRDASLGSKSSLPKDEPLTEVDEEKAEPDIQEVSKLKAELDNLPTVGKRLAVHLEQGIRDDLMKLCDSNDITPEIFIEAAIAFLQDQPNKMPKVIANAKKRLAERKRAGLVRRTLAMMQKYGS
ncbi:hypothetical protein IQ243_20540 [Nostocales cyanobacterium LEGE 11386]|nr:hypothetical protein [Nostocales cyanobacterium LEGE 11386]